MAPCVGQEGAANVKHMLHIPQGTGCCRGKAGSTARQSAVSTALRPTAPPSSAARQPSPSPCSASTDPLTLPPRKGRKWRARERLVASQEMAASPEKSRGHSCRRKSEGGSSSSTGAAAVERVRGWNHGQLANTLFSETTEIKCRQHVSLEQQQGDAGSWQGSAGQAAVPSEPVPEGRRAPGRAGCRCRFRRGGGAQ